ncbi:MAG: zinc-ribbon domain-containing protein [Candidatus Helarchaeota archaeon]
MVIICSQCGTQCEDDMRFCSVCGAPLRQLGSNPINSQRNNVPRNNRTRERNPIINNTEEISPPNLFEILSQAKAKKNSANNTNSINPQQTQTQISSNNNVETVTVQATPSRVSLRRRIKVPIKTEKLPPAKLEQLHELLRSLNKLDKLLEASAIMRRDGTILVSAVSDKYNENMMSMVAMNIFDIAMDSIKALSGGTLKLLTMIADNSLVMLSWINSQTVLIIITSPKSQIGLISMYSQLISQKIDKVLRD